MCVICTYMHMYRTTKLKLFLEGGSPIAPLAGWRLGSLDIRLVSGFEPSLGDFGSCQGASALLPLKKCSFSYVRARQICWKES